MGGRVSIGGLGGGVGLVIGGGAGGIAGRAIASS
jgi:hypothetical protein